MIILIALGARAVYCHLKLEGIDVRAIILLPTTALLPRAIVICLWISLHDFIMGY